MLEPCQNHVKDRNISFKLDTSLIRVSYEHLVRVLVSYMCLTWDTPFMRRVRASYRNPN